MVNRCIRIRLRPGTTDRVRSWLAEAADSADEFAAVNREGGITWELAFLESTPDGDFLLLIQECADAGEAMAWFAASTHPLVVQTRDVISEVSEHVELVELLAAFGTDA